MAVFDNDKNAFLNKFWGIGIFLKCIATSSFCTVDSKEISFNVWRLFYSASYNLRTILKLCRIIQIQIATLVYLTSRNQNCAIEAFIFDSLLLCDGLFFFACDLSMKTFESTIMLHTQLDILYSQVFEKVSSHCCLLQFLRTMSNS